MRLRRRSPCAVGTPPGTQQQVQIKPSGCCAAREECEAVHFTLVEGEHECDTFMPDIYAHPRLRLWSASEPQRDRASGTRFHFLVFTPKDLTSPPKVTRVAGLPHLHSHIGSPSLHPRLRSRPAPTPVAAPAAPAPFLLLCAAP